MNEEYLKYVSERETANKLQRFFEKVKLDRMNSLFAEKNAAQWLEEESKKEASKALFGEFWTEGELCILFADTNLGKSILAVQIAHSITNEDPVGELKMETMTQPVVYIDFEMTSRQFASRYTGENGERQYFNENFIRLQPDQTLLLPDGVSYEDFLKFSIEKCIVTRNAKILIIDNITFLNKGNEKTKPALELMKFLKELKSKHELSILVLAHTPKRNLFRPITRNDLQGSKMLINFCDSAFAIGESHKDKNLRYLKQIKSRSNEIIYDGENVLLCMLEKAGPILRLWPLKCTPEGEHLKKMGKFQREELIGMVKQYAEEGRGQRWIARELGIAEGTVNKYRRAGK